jgi:hypothetical protein
MEERICITDENDGDSESLSCAFLEVTPQKAKSLYDGLIPFAAPGNWVDALCRRLFPLAAKDEPVDPEDARKHEFFALFLTGVADDF